MQLVSPTEGGRRPSRGREMRRSRIRKGPFERNIKPYHWPFSRNRVALPLISGAGRNTRVLLRGTTASLKEGFQTIRATFMCGDHLYSFYIDSQRPWLTFGSIAVPRTLVDRKFVLNYRGCSQEKLDRCIRQNSTPTGNCSSISFQLVRIGEIYGTFFFPLFIDDRETFFD